MLKLTVRRNRLGPVRGRHPWVFSGALLHLPEGIESGMPVVLEDESGNFLAQGYFNSYSQIAVRVWSWDKSEEVNDEFFEKRIKQALELRELYVQNKKTDALSLAAPFNPTGHRHQANFTLENTTLSEAENKVIERVKELMKNN